MRQHAEVKNMQWIDGKIKVTLLSLKIKVLLLMVLRVNLVDIKLLVQLWI